MDEATEQQIRRRAYELWVAAGKPEGSSLRFWKDAEAQVAAEAETAPDADRDPGPAKA